MNQIRLESGWYKKAPGCCVCTPFSSPPDVSSLCKSCTSSMSARKHFCRGTSPKKAPY